MLHELVEKEMTAVRNAAHGLWERVDELLHRKATEVKAPEVSAPPTEAKVEPPPEAKPPAV